MIHLISNPPNEKIPSQVNRFHLLIKIYSTELCGRRPWTVSSPTLSSYQYNHGTLTKVTIFIGNWTRSRENLAVLDNHTNTVFSIFAYSFLTLLFWNFGISYNHPEYWFLFRRICTFLSYKVNIKSHFTLRNVQISPLI